MAGLNPPRWLAPLLVIVLIVGVVATGRLLQPRVAPAVAVACPDLRAGCAARVDGRDIGFGVRGELKALAPFEVWLKAPGAGSAQASFAMVGMDMGFNLYTLRRDSSGIFRSRVTLPVCVSGRREWVMTIKVDGQALSVPFVTEL